MKCALVIGGKVYVAWKRKMLHDVFGGHQEYNYIHEKIDLWRIEFCSWLRPRSVSRLRARFARLFLELGRLMLSVRLTMNRLLCC